MRILIVFLAVFAACASETQQFSADLVPEIHLEHTYDAELIVTANYGISIDAVDSIRWVASGLTDGRDAVAGLTIGCRIWVIWWSPSWTSGAASDGPTISHTAFAHELAHCAEYLLTGNGDHNHVDPTWWSTGGKVDQANQALETAGL